MFGMDISIHEILPPTKFCRCMIDMKINIHEILPPIIFCRCMLDMGKNIHKTRLGLKCQTPVKVKSLLLPV